MVILRGDMGKGFIIFGLFVVWNCNLVSKVGGYIQSFMQWYMVWYVFGEQ